MDLPMNRNFEIYAKEHYQEMLCEAEKMRTLAFLKKARKNSRQPIRIKQPAQSPDPVLQLEDCPVSPSFWYSSL